MKDPGFFVKGASENTVDSEYCLKSHSLSYNGLQNSIILQHAVNASMHTNSCTSFFVSHFCSPTQYHLMPYHLRNIRPPCIELNDAAASHICPWPRRRRCGRREVTIIAAALLKVCSPYQQSNRPQGSRW